jgi:hypothetical protein
MRSTPIIDRRPDSRANRAPVDQAIFQNLIERWDGILPFAARRSREHVQSRVRIDVRFRSEHGEAPVAFLLKSAERLLETNACIRTPQSNAGDSTIARSRRSCWQRRRIGHAPGAPG